MVLGLSMAVIVALTGLLGFVLGVAWGRKSSGPAQSVHQPTEPTPRRRLRVAELDGRFGPCPNCRVPCNLEEWRCGSCNYTLHEF